MIAGQGAAPRLATLEHFKGRGGIPARGIEAAAVPAALDACLTLLDRFGTMTFTQVVAPTRRCLRRPAQAGEPGTPISRGRSKHWSPPRLRPIPAARPRRPATARGGCGWWPTRSTADRSPAASTPGRGPTEGLIRYVDLATHTTRIEEPVSVGYRGLTIYKCGPWTQGPYLLEALQILEDIDLKAMGHNRPEAVHTIVETMKLALADRDTFYADPAVCGGAAGGPPLARVCRASGEG